MAQGLRPAHLVTGFREPRDQRAPKQARCTDDKHTHFLVRNEKRNEKSGCLYQEGDEHRIGLPCQNPWCRTRDNPCNKGLEKNLGVFIGGNFLKWTGDG